MLRRWWVRRILGYPQATRVLIDYGGLEEAWLLETTAAHIKVAFGPYSAKWLDKRHLKEALDPRPTP